MRHSIAVNAWLKPLEQLAVLSDSAKSPAMGGYASIDPILLAWAEARGLHVYIGHKQNDVRSMTVYVWIGARHESTGHIWLDPENELGLVGVHATAGSFRFDDAVAPEKLSSALDAVSDRLAEYKLRADEADQTSISPRM